MPQGLKPLIFCAFSARLKSCPDTRPADQGSCFPMSQKRDMGHPSALSSKRFPDLCKKALQLNTHRM